MASILRQIVAGPRARHPEAGLDLCYVTDNIVATSGPSGTYPQLAYRNPLSQLVKFLDHKHGDQWAIWEFRAEGTGYPDSEVYNRIYHYPWPDHHPPPFKLIPLIMGSMRNWLKGHAEIEKATNVSGGAAPKKGQEDGRVVVVHCKAGKGRSGTVSCSYLISEEGWKAEDALKRFTDRRMRPGFGAGVSIPSQLRWITYVDRWTQHGKRYVERPVEILEVHVWGLRDGVKVCVEGFTDDGRTIKNFHTFNKDERELVRGAIKRNTGMFDTVQEVMRNEKNNNATPSNDGAPKVGNNPIEPSIVEKAANDAQRRTRTPHDLSNNSGDVVYRPTNPIILETNDIEIDFERRNKAGMTGLTMVTSVAHVWFNAFFEGHGPENNGVADSSGVFEIEWDAMDGIKGSARKGTRAFDKLAVVWKTVPDAPGRKASFAVNEPSETEGIKDIEPADWRGEDAATPSVRKKQLGIREEDPASAPLSRANSPGHAEKEREKEEAIMGDDSDTEGTQTFGLDGSGVGEGKKGTRGPLLTSRDLPGPTHLKEGEDS